MLASLGSAGADAVLSLVWSTIGMGAGGLLLWWAIARSRHAATAQPPPVAVVSRAPLAAWRALRDQIGAEGDGDRLTLATEGVELEIEREELDVGDTTVTRVYVRARGNLAPLGATIASAGGVVTGDAAFDGMVRVTGDPALALTLLTGSLRRRLATAVSQGWTMTSTGDGARLERSYGIEYLPGVVEDVADAKRLARELRPPPSLVDKYLERLEHEPMRAVRWRLAEVAAREWLGTPAIRARLAAHPDPSVRMRLARLCDAAELWATLSDATMLAAAEGGDHDAFEVLGARGGVDAIPELRRIGAAISEKARASSAILAIQARARGGGGELALAEGEAGGLSVVRERD